MRMQQTLFSRHFFREILKVPGIVRMQQTPLFLPGTFFIEILKSWTWVLEWMAESLHQGLAQWIQCKLGKQYLWKKVTLPWESNPGPNLCLLG